MRRFSASRAIFGAAGIAAMAIAQQSLGDNLLVNPGFEAPNTTVDTDCTGWTFQFTGQRSNFHVGENPKGGTRDFWVRTFDPMGGITQNVAVVAQSNYSLSAQTYFETAYPTTISHVQMGMIWLDSGGNPIGQPAAIDIDPASNPTTNTWASQSVSGTAPMGATQVMVSLGWLGGASVPGQQSAFFDNADLEGLGTPPTISTWATDGSGDWNDSGNWSTGTVPTGVNAEADLFDAIHANRTVFSDSAITAGTIHFNNSNTYVIAGAGSLTMQVSSGTAQIIVDQGTQKMNLPMTIASNTVLNVAPTATLLISDPININTGKTLTQSGGGTVTFQSIVSVASGAGVVFGNSSHAHELDIAATGTAAIAGTGSVFTVDILGNGGKLDVKNNSLVVAYGNGADPKDTIKSQLTTGYANGAWNGVGINSSSATPRIGVGWKDDTTAKAVTAKYAYYGDANLDGKVNTADFTALASHFNTAAANAIWVNGDFNYDGKVNALDFNAVATNFGAAPLPGDALGSLVPEPMTLAPLTLAAIAARRRRVAR